MSWCPECSHFGEVVTTYCRECFAVLQERKRIIALARLRGKEGEFPYGEELAWFANELEAEDG